MKKVAPVRMTSTYFLKLRNNPGFHVIFPNYEDPYEEAGVEVGTLLNVRTYSETDYKRIVRGERGAAQKYLQEFFCSVESIKKCRLSRLEVFELETSLAFSWDTLPEGQSFQEYIIKNPTKLLDLVLSVYYVEFPQYDLSTLNVYFNNVKSTGSEFSN